MLTSRVLVSRPYIDTGAVAQSVSRPPAPDPESAVKDNTVAGTSAGLATAGFRSAKYSLGEWVANHSTLLKQAAEDGGKADKIFQLSRALKAETDTRTSRAQSAGTKLLGERLQDIHRWRSELEHLIQRLTAETDLLVGTRRRLEKALDATEIPFAISTDNLTCRERRFGPDLVTDPVEEQLLKEVELIKNVQALLQKTLDQTLQQIRLNREVKQKLESDWSDKHQAYSLDDQCGRLNNRSMDTQQHPGSALMHDQVCDPELWLTFTRDNLTLAEREEAASQTLRQLSERVLRDSAMDLQEQCAAVDQAFSRRCSDLDQAKTQLELQLKQVLEKIGVQEKNISLLQEALQEKEAPLRVAQTRLYHRTLRPSVELCRDQPQLSLLEEVSQLGSTRSALQQQLCDARESLSALEQSRMFLEKDFACKKHSLLIEREKCMTHRSRFPPVVVLSGF